MVPGSIDSNAEGGRLLVACTCDLGGLVDGWEPFVRQLERFEHLVAPPPVRDVEEERAGRVRCVDRPLAGETQADVVLR